MDEIHKSFQGKKNNDFLSPNGLQYIDGYMYAYFSASYYW